jgi:hypothetical protein
MKTSSFPAHLDDTMISQFRSCPASWYYRYHRNLRSLGDASIDLIAGGAYATGLETARKLFYSPTPPPLDEVLHETRLAVLRRWGDSPLFEDKPKNLANVLLAVEDYFKHWGIATDPIQPVMWDKDGVKIPAVEFSFALPLPIYHPEDSAPIYYTGKLDLIGQRNGQIWLVDDKTCSGFGPSWINAWSVRSQFTGYAWAARESGFPAAGVCIRGCAFTANNNNFLETFTPRPNWMIDKWYEELQITITAMIQAWERGQFPQAANSACNSYNRPCDYTLLCTSRDPEVFIPNNYKEFIWNPLVEGI